MSSATAPAPGSRTARPAKDADDPTGRGRGPGAFPDGPGGGGEVRPLPGVEALLPLGAIGQEPPAAIAEFPFQAGQEPQGLGGEDPGLGGEHLGGYLRSGGKLERVRHGNPPLSVQDISAGRNNSIAIWGRFPGRFHGESP